MGLLRDILDFADGMPDWQSDAMRRVIVQGALSPDDLREIRQMIERHPEAPQAQRLQRAHLPSATDGRHVQLLALSGLEHVNAFAAGRSLAFESKGLTVLFGENGAGKSGFSRVLKRACRARRVKPVLPDAFGAPGNPQATISYSVDGGAAQTHCWAEGDAVHPDLGLVSVFDSQCGADYVSTEAPCDFQPFGLPQLAELAKGQVGLQAVIQAERSAIKLDKAPLQALIQDPFLAPHLKALGAGTDLDALASLATLTAENLARIEEITTVQATLDVETPAAAKDASAARLTSAAARCRRIEQITSDEAFRRLFERLRVLESAEVADDAAQALVRGTDVDLLPGTGGEAWKSLFKAAEKFSRQTQPGAHAHPSSDEDAHCVLCQQHLEQPARSRIADFRKYVSSEAAVELAAATKSLDEAIALVKAADDDPLEEALISEIATLSPDLAKQVPLARRSWVSRKGWVETRDWHCPRPAHSLDPQLSASLLELAASLEKQAQELRASKDGKKIAELAAEKSELVARQRLAEMLPLVQAYVQSAKKHADLTKTQTALDTRQISIKISRLSTHYVNDALLNAVLVELRALNYRRRPPALKSLTRQGVNRVAIELSECKQGAADVLSEGEQRAMGLAMFLAETGLRGDRSTVVFDDPSTSLDHRSRRHMAKRLIELSADRPVVVFTHDAVFLTELQLETRERGAPVAFRTIQWADKAPGAVSEGLAWENKPFKDQMAAIKADARAAASGENDYLNDDEKRVVRDLHGRLRGAIERGIRDVILNGTVHPFLDEIKVAKFGAMVGLTFDEWRDVVEHHDACSGLTAAHDTSPDRQQDVPTATSLVERLAEIEALFGEFERRRKAFETEHFQPLMDARSKPRKR